MNSFQSFESESEDNEKGGIFKINNHSDSSKESASDDEEETDDEERSPKNIQNKLSKVLPGSLSQTTNIKKEKKKETTKKQFKKERKIIQLTVHFII